MKRRNPLTFAGMIAILAFSGGCAQQGLFTGRRTTVGTLKANVSQLESEKEQLQRQVAELETENRRIESRLTRTERENASLASRLDDARGSLASEGSSGSSGLASASRSRAGARSYDDEEFIESAPTRKAKSRKAPPFARIPGQITPADPSDVPDRDPSDTPASDSTDSTDAGGDPEPSTIGRGWKPGVTVARGAAMQWKTPRTLR
jgi:outer membrane murein-binding lipoprotein Lpp